ncbi:LOW QUALITY PROTEIN: hypothetical protein V2J09_018204 [Rumex salicifolius]
MIIGRVPGCKSNYSQQLCRMRLLYKLLLFFFMFHDGVILCSGFRTEGLGKLKFWDRVVRDPADAHSGSNGSGEDADPCSLFGAKCSDGEVATLNVGHMVNPAQRRLQQKQNLSKNSRANPPTLAKPYSDLRRPSSPSRSPSHSHFRSGSHSPSSSPAPSPSPSQSPTRKLHPPVLAPTTKIEAVAHEESKKSHGLVIGLSVVGGALVIIVAVAAIVVCQSSRMVTVKPWATGLSGQLQKAFVSGVPKLKRSELETACEDFSNIIGTLTDSTVYKGTLSNGVEIAVVSSMVKSGQHWSKDLQTQFRKKIETLSKVNHKNFVNVLGYCEEEKPFTRMMVFEYAPNGTLFEHLHIQEAERLDWKMRLRIIMGMSYCLDYMHQLDPPIPHRDLHSSSVHLCEDYAAKVSDFSFWTEATSKKMHSSSMRSPSMQLLEASMADIESNVYSFGVLLFEIITGKIPYADDGAVKDCVWEYLGGEDLPRDAIDPTLDDAFQEEEMQKMFEIIKDCVNPDITERPTMSEVALRLKEVTSMEPEAAVPRLSPLWWAELEIMVA